MIGTTMGFWPSMYAGIEAQYELGSIGGLNARAYLGYNFGFNSKGGFVDRINEFFVKLGKSINVLFWSRSFILRF